MKQVVQPTSKGPVEVIDAPVPEIGPTQVLVRSQATLISAGTERAVTKLARASLLGKARARPDLARQVLHKARRDGIGVTAAAVRTRLSDDLALGYSGAGVVVAVGDAVRGLRPGQRVATAGSGYASHAGYQAVPATLVAAVPDAVTSEQASFATVASIALHGFRQADVGVGSKVVVVGLGLLGQLATRIALAAGCEVAGVDVNPAAVARATADGALGLVEAGDATTSQILEWSRGRGADAVLITAAAHGNSSIIRTTPDRCRDRAVVVAVGDIGLDLDRNDFYHKELELRLARSYGPGRYDASYEEWAVDYPVGYVRWTEGRNLEAVLDLIDSGRLAVDDLITHRFPIERATEAYELLDKPAGAVGIVLSYPDGEEASGSIELRDRRARPAGALGIGVCGAGLFVKTNILPSLRSAGLADIVHVSSSSGTTAARLAAREGIARASSGIDDVLADPAVDLVVIATPHRTHAETVVAALQAGKHVYVEKPLAITDQELDEVIAALDASPGQLHVGFNRRWSPMVATIRDRLTGSGPLTLHYRVSAGPLPAGHWYADRREGGRLLGEGCHFIDTARAIVGHRPVAVTCAGPDSDRHDSYTLLVEYADGSVATITYAADGHPSTEKERCEILGRGHTIVLDDYAHLLIDGDRVKVPSGKGHVQAAHAFATALRDGQPLDVTPAIETTATALAALRSLKERRVVEVPKVTTSRPVGHI